MGVYSDGQLAAVGLSGAVFTPVVGTFSNAADLANGVFEVEFPWVKTITDVNGGDATNEFVLGYLPRNSMLVSAKFTPVAAATIANITNFATLVIASRDVNGANTANLALINTTPVANGGTGNWTAWNSVDLNVYAYDANNTRVQAGGCVTFKINKVANVATCVLPGGTLTLRLRYV